MRVKVHIGLDFEGNHTFSWEPSAAPDAIEVTKATLDRWASEREAFGVAYLRWKRVVDEIEEHLVKAEQERNNGGIVFATAGAARARVKRS